MNVTETLATASEHLDEADLAIDTKMNCHTPEFEALDHLRKANREILRVCCHLAGKTVGNGRGSFFDNMDKKS